MRGVGNRREGCITFGNPVGWYWLIYFIPEIDKLDVSQNRHAKKYRCLVKESYTKRKAVCKPTACKSMCAVLWNRHYRDCMTTRPAVLVLLPTLPGRPFHQQHEASLWQRTASRTMPPSARVLMASTWAAQRGPCRVGWEVSGVLRQQMDIPMVFLGVEVAEMVRFSAPKFGIWGPKWRVDS